MPHEANLDMSAELSIEKGLQLYNAGDFGKAKEVFEELDRRSPDSAEILVGLGMSNTQCGNLPEAEKHLRRATTINDTHDVACRSLALLLHKIGDLEEAETFAARSTQLSPGNAQNLLTLGVMKGALGKIEEAVACYQSALAIHPSYPEALYNLGTITFQKRDFGQAVRLFVLAIANRPSYMDAYKGLFTAFKEVGSLREALVLLKYIASKSPEDRELQNTLSQFTPVNQEISATSLHGESSEDVHETKSQAAPLSSYEEPDQQHPHLHNNTGETEGEEALRKPNEVAEAFTELFQLPHVFSSTQEIHDARQSLIYQLEQIMEDSSIVADPLAALKVAPSFLSSLPLHDRLLRTKLASAVLLKAPSLLRISPHLAHWQDNSPLGLDATPLPPETLGTKELFSKALHFLKRKIRIGICSDSFDQFSVGGLFAAPFAELPRELFELHVFSSSQELESISSCLRLRADSLHVLPNSLEKASALISSTNLDSLCFTDPESAAFTYLLAFARLAPIQCATWGTTETTGIPSMTYFLASQALVGGRAQSQYSESLVTLTLPTAYSIPAEGPTERATPLTRATLALPQHGSMYVCPESLERIHPEMDYAFQRILQGDKNNFLVILALNSQEGADQFLDRLGKSMPDCLEQVFVRPLSSQQEVVELLALSDVVLDPFHCSSPLALVKSLSFGKPIVTLPGRTLRSRIAYAYYTQMNYNETIASSVEHYIQIALHLGRDQTYRSKVASCISQSYAAISACLSNMSFELGRFFLMAVNKNHKALFLRDQP